jgi:hypothetical protein
LLFDEYHYNVEQLARGKRLRFAEESHDIRGLMTLIDAERLVKLYTLQLWFAFQYANPKDIELLEQRRDAANTAIEGFLRARARSQRKSCRVCGRLLPRFSSYNLCQECFSTGRRM